MYIAMSLKTLAISMIGIFIPIFLLTELGFTLYNIVVFYVFNTLAYMISSPFTGKFASRFGLRKAAVITAPLFILFYLGLYNYPSLLFNINYLAVLLGFAESFFWIPFITHFIRSSDKKHRSEEVGFLSGSAIVASMTGPLIGGLIITLFGFNFLFLIVSIFLFLSIFPFLFIKETHEPFKCSFKDMKSIAGIKSLKLVSIGGINMVDMVFWPMFLFVAIGTYAELGLIFFIAAFAAFVASFYFGAFENRGELMKVLKWGALFYAVTWFARASFKGALVMSMVTIIGAFAHEMVEVPFNTLNFDRLVRKKYLSEYVVYRGIMTGVGRLIILGIIALFLEYSPSFLAAGVLSLGFLL
tara:strand:- start:16116 stop:17183 length:1068 start_codon:yes stop_codon:yes gene_type:complete